MAQFEMHQFPLNGVLAAFVLALWLIVWMGFGVVEQLEVLFTRVPRRRRD
jgi:hypothetical protein